MRHLRTVIVATLLVLSVALLVGCGSGTPSAPSGAGTTPAAPSGSGAAPASVSVSMANLAFVPADITVAVGGTVTFTNDDSVAHVVAGDTWSSGNMAPGATFSQTFATAGSFPIVCTIHPSMTANVTVK
jgi:plastocyanin